MKHLVCSIYDTKAACFNTPFFTRNEAMAVRSFEAEVRREGSDFNRFPGDFSLFTLGEYDDENGSFIPSRAPVSVVSALAILATEGK